MKTFERRMTASGLEIREASDHLTLTGYASTFEQPYRVGWFEETVDGGAFARTLGQHPDVRLLINHTGLPLARTARGTKPGTLKLTTDTHGLIPEARLELSDPDVQALAPKMLRGDVDQMSFSFIVMGDDGDEWSRDMTQRRLRAVDMNNQDVSVVTYPANQGAKAVLRAAEAVSVESVTSALRTIERRGGSPEDMASVLTRALAYFTAIDNIVDSAQEELAAALDIPNPDGDPDGDDDAAAMSEMLAATVAHELRQRLLLLAG